MDKKKQKVHCIRLVTATIKFVCKTRGHWFESNYDSGKNHIAQSVEH